MRNITRLLIAIVILCGLVMPGCGVRKGVEDVFAGLGMELEQLTPTEAVQRAFFSYDADERRDAISRISASPFGGEEQYVRTYRVLLKDEPDPTVRAALIHALGEHGEVEDAMQLSGEMHPSNPVFIRWEAAKALRKIHNPTVASRLVDVVRNDEDADVRAAAADALGQYPTDLVFQTLVTVLDDKDYKVAVAANRSLTLLTGQDFKTNGSAWLAWENENMGNLFAGQQVYTYAPYVKPRGWMDKAKFWKENKPVEAPTPAGLTQEKSQPTEG